MTLDQLKTDLTAILAVEEATPVDWARVDRMCLELIRKLPTEDSYPKEVVYHYLDDSDVRRKDPAYGRGQRVRLHRWLGEEHRR